MSQVVGIRQFREGQSRSNWPTSVLQPTEATLFQENFNRLPFQLSHNLGNHPLFEIPYLVELSEFLLRDKLPGRVTVFTDDAHVQQGWNRSNRRGITAAECLADIQSLKAWVMLKDIQKHSAYSHLINQFVYELEELTNLPIRRDITWIDAYLFVASPGMVTPYHIDHESNFLLQIHGEKTINLFNPAERTILTEGEIERYYVGDLSAAKFRDDVQAKAMVVAMKPGVGVHHPPLAPHWVRNGSDYSVSLSILFFMRAFDLRAKVYQVNHYLRRLGFRPTPPGQSELKDRVKQMMMSDLGYHPRHKQEIVRFGLNKYAFPAQMMAKLRQRASSASSH